MKFDQLKGKEEKGCICLSKMDVHQVVYVIYAVGFLVGIKQNTACLVSYTA